MPSRAGPVHGQQPAGGQLAQDPDHPEAGHAAVGDDIADQRELAAAVEHRQPPEDRRLLGVQQRVAALDHSAQRVATLGGHLVEVVHQVAR